MDKIIMTLICCVALSGCVTLGGCAFNPDMPSEATMDRSKNFWMDNGISGGYDCIKRQYTALDCQDAIGRQVKKALLEKPDITERLPWYENWVLTNVNYGVLMAYECADENTEVFDCTNKERK